MDSRILQQDNAELRRQLADTEAALAERTQAERALRESQERLALALESSGEASWGWDVGENRIDEWSPRFRELYGFGPADPARFETWLERVHPDDRPRLTTRVDQILKSADDNIWREEFRIVHPERGVRWLAGVGRCYRDAHGRALRIVGINFDITDRRATDEKLRLTIERLQLATRAAGVGIYDYDVAADLCHGTPELFAIFGLQLETPLNGPQLRNLVHAEDRERISAKLLESFRPDSDGRCAEEFRIVRQDNGASCWIFSQCQTFFEGEGAARRAVRNAGALVDISARKLAEEALRKSEQRLHRVLETDAVGVLFFDATGTVIEANDVFLRMTGYTRAQVTARELHWRKMTPPDFVAASEAQMQQFAGTGRIGPYEKEYYLADGSRRWLLFAGRDLGDGTIAEYCVDIHERKQAERALRESEALLAGQKAAFQAALNGQPLEAALDVLVRTAVELAASDARAAFYTVGPDGLLHHLTGMGAAYAQDLDGFKIGPDSLACGLALETGKPVILHDIEQEPRWDTLRPLARKYEYRGYWSFPVRTEGGPVLGTFAIYYRDPRTPSPREVELIGALTHAAAIIFSRNHEALERQHAEAERNQLLDSERAARTEAEKQTRLKDEFLAGVSHELRSPLNGILGWAQLMKRKPDAQTVGDGLEAISKCGHALTGIIDDLLDMNRILAGKFRLDLKTIDLADVMGEALAAICPSADARKISLQAELDEHLGATRGDPVRLQQAVLNLLGNAVKFTPSGGRIQVRLERHDSGARIVVSDTGRGIPTDALHHIFDRFRQADSSFTRQHGGLGLGLAIAKQIIELHGGTIRASSAGEGQGATFQIELPLTGEPLPLPDESLDATEFQPDAKLPGVHLLIVDDDPGACHVLERLLRITEAEVRCVHSGAAALEQIAADPPDALLCDIGMPGMDGLTVIRRLRASGSTLPAIAVTAFARTEDRIRALQAGFNMHVSKPVDAQELVAALQALLKGVGRRMAVS